VIRPFVKLTVPISGVPVRVSSQEADPNARVACHGFMIQVLPTNTGKIYVGTQAMSKATFANMIAILAIPTSNSIPTFSAALTLAPNAVHLHDLYIDADNAQDGVIISYLIA